MWGFLEQQSFPLSKSDYLKNLANVLEVVNRLGKSSEVRGWLSAVEGKPRPGKSLSLPLRGGEILEEFVI